MARAAERNTVDYRRMGEDSTKVFTWIERNTEKMKADVSTFRASAEQNIKDSRARMLKLCTT
jgi:hypothetical protein